MTASSNARAFDKSNRKSLIAICVVAIVIAGCSRLKNDNRPTGASSPTSTASPSSSQTSAPTSVDSSAKPTTWEVTAAAFSGKDEHVFTLQCPPGGTYHSVWGSDIYTADSSICTAAVHSGLITYEQGGTVTIELRKGRNVYGASERNGVTTGAYGPWQLSFVFQTRNTEAVVRAAEEATTVLWNTSATSAGFTAGQQLKFNCPPDGKAGSVWGTDIYTLDSSICTAAVHAGKIQLESGGQVTIERRPGEPRYQGSVRNGITTSDYGQYDGSFIVK